MKKSLLLFAGLAILAGCSQMEQDFSDVNRLSDGNLVEKVIFEVLPVKDGLRMETFRRQKHQQFQMEALSVLYGKPRILSVFILAEDLRCISTSKTE